MVNHQLGGQLGNCTATTEIPRAAGAAAKRATAMEMSLRFLRRGIDWRLEILVGIRVVRIITMVKNHRIFAILGSQNWEAQSYGCFIRLEMVDG